MSIFNIKPKTPSHTAHSNLPEGVVFTTFTPIMRAADSGHLNIINFFVDYFDGLPTHPDFDPHKLDEKTGENTGLIACKSGNLALVRYLYEVCSCDILIKNKRNETAL
jgi:hypothetical protein